MSSGGYRANAGRPKGRKSKQKIIKDEIEIIKTEGPPPDLPENHILPLNYMLRILNDPDASDERKDRMAALAAPYCHAKPSAGTGKKEERQEAAKTAAAGKFSPGAPPAKLIAINGGK